MKRSQLIFFLLVILTVVLCETKPRKCGIDTFQCGNYCTGDHNEICICGNVTLSRHSPAYCCLPPGDRCHTVNVEDLFDDVWCPTGQPLPRSEPCHGACSKDSLSTKIVVDGHTSCDPVTECPHKEGFGHYMCGDICTNYRSQCECGNTSLSYYHTQHYCCIPPEDHCTMGNLTTQCKTGRAIHKSEPCDGKCLEDREPIHQTATDHSTCGYTDYCDYKYSDMCGDVCTSPGNNCTCGADEWALDYLPHYPKYCCTSPEDHCYNEGYDLGGYPINPDCANGTTSERSDICHGRCYNSYQNSLILGEEAQYTCPDGRCVTVKGSFMKDRCR